MASLRSTDRLIRLALRRDRVWTTVWVAALLLLVAWSVVEYKALYSTAADLQARADLIVGNAATIALTGPGYGFDHPTIGNMLANDLLGWYAVALALMSIFQIVRHTRAEEEDGRAELLSATGVGRHARSAAALAVTFAANALVAILTVLALIAFGLEPAGAVAFGLASGLCGVLFAAVALAAAQVSAHARVASATAGALLGGAYVLRAAGDVGDGTLSWFSPIGWTQAVRPFADERWWPLLLLAAAAVCACLIALALERRRDLGAGLVSSRPGPARGSAALAGLVGVPLRLQRIAIPAWALGTLFGGLVYGSVATDIEGMLRENPTLAQYLGGGVGDLEDGYFVMVLMILSLVATGFALQSVLRIRSEETSGRAELILATPRSRIRWAGGYALVTLVGSLVVIAAGGLGLGLGYVLAGGDGSRLATLLGASLLWTPAVLVMAAAAGALLGAAPRALPVIWAALGYCFFVAFFGDGLDLPDWLRGISPFEHVPEAPATALEPGPLIWLSLVALALTAAALAALRHRDIG